VNPRYPLDEWAESLGYDSPRDMLETEYAKRGSLKAVGDHLGVHLATVGLWLHDMGIPVKGKGGANNPWGRHGRNGVTLKQRIMALPVSWREMPHQDLANLLQCHPATASQLRAQVRRGE